MAAPAGAAPPDRDRETHSWDVSQVDQWLSDECGSLVTADRGVDKYSWDASGNLVVHGTGIHLKVGGTAYSIGLWRLTFDEDRPGVAGVPRRPLGRTAPGQGGGAHPAR